MPGRTRAQPALTADTLRTRRLALGLTQAELARSLRVRANTVARWERGEQQPLYPTRVMADLVRLERRPKPDQPRASTIGRLPLPLTSLVGRQDSVNQVCELLQAHRLVTLVGPAGIGKTRLALAVAVALEDRFHDGVVFVPLAALANPSLVLPSIAQTVGVRVRGPRWTDGLAAFLRARQVLLVLDNFEQVRPAAPAITRLLGYCPQLRVLVTSRALLQVTGERAYRTPPLGLPGRDMVRPEQMCTSASVRLFVERAQANRPEFELTTANAPGVGEICRQLDGLPLAIELAAAQIRVLSPDQLLGLLHEPLDLLVGGPQDEPPRHQSLRDAIAWSYALLTPEDQRLFRWLAVFAGDCTIDGATAIAASPASSAALDVLGGLRRLVDHALLESRRGGRLGMLGTIRAFALEQLNRTDEGDAAGARHAAYYADFAEQAASPRLDGPDGPELLMRVEREHDNLRAALGWLLEHEPPGALRVAGALWSFWESRGYLSEGLDWLGHALDRAGAGAPPHHTARALIGAAALRRARGEVSAAAMLARRSTAIRRELGDAPGLSESLIILATILAQSGQMDEALAPLREAIAIRTQRRDLVGSAWALLELGTIMSFQADFAAARAHAREALGLRQGQPANVLDAWLARCLGSLESGAGNIARARPLLEHAVELFRSRGDTTGLAWSLLGVGDLLLRQTDAAEGQAIVEQALGHFETLSEHHGAAVALLLLGRPVTGPLPDDADGRTLTAAWRFALGRDRGPPARLGRAAVDRLTVREREVLTLLARHYSNREIAEALTVSVRTVDRHVANIYSKIKVSNRRQAVAYALTQDG